MTKDRKCPRGKMQSWRRIGTSWLQVAFCRSPTEWVSSEQTSEGIEGVSYVDILNKNILDRGVSYTKLPFIVFLEENSKVEIN